MKLTSLIKSVLLVAAASLPCACTTVVEPPATPTTTVRESHSSTVYPLDATRTQTTTTIRQ